MEDRTCPVCSKIYRADPKRLKYGRQTTCSRECSYSFRYPPSKVLTLNCAVCQKAVEKYPSQIKAKTGLVFCSGECHYKARGLGLSSHVVTKPYNISKKTREQFSDAQRERNLLRKAEGRYGHTDQKSDLPKKYNKEGARYNPIDLANFSYDITFDDAFGHWLAGFIAGEGCFRVHKQRKGAYYACTFTLKQRDDDSAIIHEIHSNTHIGSTQPDKKGRGTSNPCLVWVVASRIACLQLTKILDRFPLRGRKRLDYAVWREAVLYSAVKHWEHNPDGTRDWSKMEAFKKAIEDARTYRAPTERNPFPRPASSPNAEAIL